MSDPIAQFREWLAEADDGKTRYPQAFALATANADGVPSVRTLLCKGVDERGFLFYTNLSSHKARDLAENPLACMHFLWNEMHRQVRVAGSVVSVDDAEADAYWATRPRTSQIGGWASRQSEPLDGRLTLEKRIAVTTARFGVGTVPRPDFWSGFRLVPRTIEFWEEAPYRLHRRDVWTKTPDGWEQGAIYP